MIPHLRATALSFYWALSLGLTLLMAKVPIVGKATLLQDPSGALIWTILLLVHAAMIVMPARHLYRLAALLTLFYIALTLRIVLWNYYLSGQVGTGQWGSWLPVAGTAVSVVLWRQLRRGQHKS